MFIYLYTHTYVCVYQSVYNNNDQEKEAMNLRQSNLGVTRKGVTARGMGSEE